MMETEASSESDTASTWHSSDLGVGDQRVAAEAPIPSPSIGLHQRFISEALQLWVKNQGAEREQTPSDYPRASDSTSQADALSTTRSIIFPDCILQPWRNEEERAAREAIAHSILDGTLTATKSRNPNMWLEYDLKLLGDATIRGFSKETPQPLYFLNEGMKSFLLPSKQYVASRALSDNKLEIGFDFRAWSRSMRLFKKPQYVRYVLSGVNQQFKETINSFLYPYASTHNAWLEMQRVLPTQRLAPTTSNDTFDLYVRAAFNGGVPLSGDVGDEDATDTQTYYQWCEENQEAISQLSDDCYTLSPNGNRFAKVLDGLIYRDPTMQAFLHDVIISNQLEACVVKKEAWKACMVSRGSHHNRAGTTSKVSGQRDRQATAVGSAVNTDQPITTVATDEAGAQPKKKNKSRKRKKKAKKQQERTYDSDETIEDPEIADTNASPKTSVHTEEKEQPSAPTTTLGETAMSSEQTDEGNHSAPANRLVIDVSVQDMMLPMKASTSSKSPKIQHVAAAQESNHSSTDSAAGISKKSGADNSKKGHTATTAKELSVATTSKQGLRAISSNQELVTAASDQQPGKPSESKLPPSLPKKVSDAHTCGKGKEPASSNAKHEPSTTLEMEPATQRSEQGQAVADSKSIEPSGTRSQKMVKSIAPISKEVSTATTTTKGKEAVATTSKKLLPSDVAQKSSSSKLNIEQSSEVDYSLASSIEEWQRNVECGCNESRQENEWQVVPSKSSTKSKAALSDARQSGPGDIRNSQVQQSSRRPEHVSNTQSSYQSRQRNGGSAPNQHGGQKPNQHIIQQQNVRQASNSASPQPLFKLDDFPAMPVSEKQQSMPSSTANLVGRRGGPSLKIDTSSKKTSTGINTPSKKAESSRMHPKPHSTIDETMYSLPSKDTKPVPSASNPEISKTTTSVQGSGSDTISETVQKSEPVLDESFATLSTIAEDHSEDFTFVANEISDKYKSGENLSDVSKNGSTIVAGSHTEANSTVGEVVDEEPLPTVPAIFILTLLDEDPRSANSLAHRGRCISAPPAVKESYDLSELFDDESSIHSRSVHSGPAEMSIRDPVQLDEDVTPMSPKSSSQEDHLSSDASTAKPASNEGTSAGEQDSNEETSAGQQDSNEETSTGQHDSNDETSAGQHDSNGETSAPQQETEKPTANSEIRRNGTRYSITFGDIGEETSEHPHMPLRHQDEASMHASEAQHGSTQTQNVPPSFPGSANMHGSHAVDNTGLSGNGALDYSAVVALGLNRQQLLQRGIELQVIRQPGPNMYMGPPVITAQGVPYLCGYCYQSSMATHQNPALLCASCGPYSMDIYCSTACLLLDIQSHYSRCRDTAMHFRHGMPIVIAPSEFQQRPWPLVHLGHEHTTREKYRQRAFSMNTRYGPFPPLLQTWLSQPHNRILPLANLPTNTSEANKSTGIYYVFRSRITSDRDLGPNPDANVICTIEFHRNDRTRHKLSRALNVLFLCIHRAAVEFVFRAIRSFILKPEIFSTFRSTESAKNVFREFAYQYELEFGFGPADYTREHKPFDLEAEWAEIETSIKYQEMTHPSLRVWDRRADADDGGGLLPGEMEGYIRL